MTKRLLILTAGIGVILAACDSEPLATPADAEPQFAVGAAAMIRQDLAQVRAATARFHDVDRAIAEGYAPVSECVAVPGLGGMGIHFLNMGLTMDAGYSLTTPEVLLYISHANGSLKLVGVEYVVVQDAWHGAGNAERPDYRGLTFDAMPAAGHSPAMYTLHAWVWAPNSAGMFEPFNPSVQCPSDGGDGYSH